MNVRTTKVSVVEVFVEGDGIEVEKSAIYTDIQLRFFKDSPFRSVV
jgi:hypothetical protein